MDSRPAQRPSRRRIRDRGGCVGRAGKKKCFFVYRITHLSCDRGQSPTEGIVFAGLRGGETAWVSRQDKVFADYYRENGLELPEDYGELVNISYEAGRSLWGNAAPGHITIEELGGRGSYSLYPGGAQAF